MNAAAAFVATTLKAAGAFVSAMLLAAVVAVGGSVGTAPDAGAWTNGACTTASGVTVIIDFQELGGGIYTRCAPGSVTSGFDALKQAGIEYQTTIRFPGFLCKIAGKPGNDPCVDASPATAYWSYWLASRGGTWCYSNWGAGNRTPPAGSVEGWSFSYNKTGSTSPPPGVAPPVAIPGVTPSSLAGNDCDPRATAPKATTTTTSPPTTKPRSPATTATKGTTPGVTAPKSSSSGPGGSQVGGGQGGAAPADGSGSTIAGANSPNGVNATDGSNGQKDTTIDAATDKTDAEVLAESESTGASGNSTDSDDPKSGGLDASGSDSLDDKERETAAVKAAEEVDLGGGGDSGSAIGVVVAVVLVVAIGSVALLRRRLGRSA